jgi:uncharacterized protein with ParB-like and HNH nuclease domain
MSELIYSVKEFFTYYLTNGNYANFNIPDYQRGYKWNASDATKLLDDLKKFEESNPKDGDFYCLQNITLVPNGEDLNVVDGQQRLTTLYILLLYYKNCKSGEVEVLKDFSNILKYSIRESTADKLKRLNNEETDWGNINPSLAEHRDEFYILTVAESIKTWFDTNSLKFDTVWNKLKLIVNKIEGKSEETIFANINGGKVPLDGADLVRAILMTKSAKEKFSELKSTEKTNQFRIRMGIEIDGINQWWSNEEVKIYYAQFISGAIQNDDLFKKDFPINLLYKIFYEIYKDSEKLKNSVKKFSFDFFEYGTDFDGNGGNNYYEMYQNILSLHLTLKDWYNNSEIYHLLGYLFFNFKGSISLETIWKEWEASNSKHDFTEKLKNKISGELEKFVEEEVGDKDQNHSRRKELLRQVEDINSDWYNLYSNQTLRLLPLLDVIYYSDKKDRKLPAVYFKVNQEDKEHIMCQNPREGEENEGIRISDAKDFLTRYFHNYGEKPEIKSFIDELEKLRQEDFISNENKERFDELLHRYSLNSIGNIVLLDLSVNRSYGNAPHNEKVFRITSEFFGNEHYIRPHTAGVFLGKDSNKPNKEWQWGIKEINDNAEKIAITISTFLGWEK